MAEEARLESVLASKTLRGFESHLLRKLNYAPALADIGIRMKLSDNRFSEMSDIIIQSRLRPQKISGSVLKRKPLIEDLKNNSSKSLILICAPAGYGKTTLAQHFLETINYPAAWLSISEDFSNVLQLQNYIVHSLKRLKENFGQATLDMIQTIMKSESLSKDKSNTLTTILGTFINEFGESFQGETILVLDDLHMIQDDANIKEYFEFLLKNIPDNLHIVITTRAIPTFNISFLNSKRKLFRLDVIDLKFNEEEINKLVKDIYSVKLDESQIEILLKKSEGWVTALHLILQTLGDNLSKADLKNFQYEGELFDFFANEIFASLNEETKNFLLTTCLLEYFTADVCNKLLEAKNSQPILDGLTSKNIFIESKALENIKGNEEKNYNYHSLFRQFLIKKLKQQKSNDALKSLYKKISDQYESANDPISAINFALSSEDYDRSISLILQHYRKYFHDMRYEMLYNWLELLPENCKNTAELQLLKGRLMKSYKANVEEANNIFKNILNGKNTKDDEILFETTLEYSSTLRFENKLDEAKSLLDKSLKQKLPAKSGKPAEARVRLVKTYCNVLYSIGPAEYDTALKYFDEAITLAKENNFKEHLIELYSNYGKILTSRGDFIKALHYFELVEKSEENVFERFLTLNDIVLLHAWSGQFEKAKKYMDEVYGINEKFKYPNFERNTIRTAFNLHFSCGDYEKTIELLREMITSDNRTNVKSFIPHFYLFMGQSYDHLGYSQKAIEFYNLAREFSDAKNEYINLVSDYRKAIIRKRTSADDTVLSALNDLLQYSEKNRLHTLTALAKFQIADYYFRLSQYDTCLSFLNESLIISKDKGYISDLVQNFVEYSHLFDLAISNNIQNKFIKEIQESLIEMPAYDWFSDEYKNRLLKNRFKLYDIYLKTFGGVEIFVRGNLIEEERWLRKKGKLILIYLMLNPSMKFTKDKMLDLFFKDLSPESAENIFHQCITNIRTATKPVYEYLKEENPSPKGKPKIKTTKKSDKESGKINVSYIIYEDKILRLNPDFVYKVDANEFDELEHKIKSIEIEDEERIEIGKRAIEIYKGELLTGFYDDWCEDLRSEFENKFTELSEELIKLLWKAKKYPDLISACENLLRADKLHEEANIKLIGAYSQLENQSMAKEKLEKFEKNYKTEYDEPLPKNIREDALKHLNAII